MRKLFQYVESLFKIQESGSEKNQLIFKKNMVRVDRILRDFYQSYEIGSLKVLRKKIVVTFLVEQDALEVQEFFIKQTSQGGLYLSDIQTDGYSSDIMKYHLVIIYPNGEFFN